MKKQILAVSLAVLTALNPLYPAIDQVMANSNTPNNLNMGKGFAHGVWGDQKQTYTTPINTDGGTKFYFPNTLEGEQVTDGSGEDSINIYELFGQEESDDSARHDFGINNSVFEQKGLDARANLQFGSGPESDAYGALRDSFYVSRPNLENDPVWKSTEAVQDMLAGRELDCDPEDSHIPDYRTCQRPNVGESSCVITHPYEVGVIDYHSGPVNYQTCGEGCITVWLGKVGDNYWSGNCSIYEHEMKLKMINPDAIISATITDKKWNDHMQIYVAGQKVWGGPNSSQFPPETSGSCELSTSWHNTSPVNVTSQLKSVAPGDLLNFKVRVSVSGAGEGYAKMVIRYDPSKVVKNDVWAGEDCIRLANDYVSAYGRHNVNAFCSDMPPLNSGACWTTNGVTVCENAFEPLINSNVPFPDISPLCKSITVVSPEGGQIQNRYTCEVEHVVDAFQKEAVVSIGAIGVVYNAIEFDLQTGSYRRISPSDTLSYTASVPILDYEDVCLQGEDYVFELESASPWYGSGFESGSHHVDTTVYYKVLQKPSCANGLVGRVMVEDTNTGSGTKWLLNGTFKFKIPRVIKEDAWYNQSCIDIANDPSYEASIQCTNYLGSGPGNCTVINDAPVCPQDIRPAPFQVDRMCQRVSVSYSIPNDAPTDTCYAFEQDNRCGFITSKCKDGTSEELITRLYERGLGRSPDPAGLAYWVSELERGDLSYDQVVARFFQAAGIRNERMANSFSCDVFEETWDCGYPAGGSNSAACAVQHLFAGDFADCKEDLIEQVTEDEIVTTRYESCEDLLILTECDATREIEEIERETSRTWNRGCFIQDTVSYQVPWHQRAAVASASLQTSGQHTSASIIQSPALSNNWTARVLLQGSGEYKKVKEGRSCPTEDTPPEEIPEGLVIETTAGGGQSCYVWVTTDIVECPDNHSLTAKITVSGSTLDYIDKDFPAEGEEVNNPCQRESDEFSDVEWECTETQRVTAGGSAISAAVRNALFPELYPGENGSPNLCVKAHAEYQTKEYAQGEFCYENMAGETICLDVNGDNGEFVDTNTCDALEARSDCEYVGRFPVEDSQGSTGFSYVYEHRYECVSERHPIERRELVPQYTCNGIVECLGDECAIANREASNDFGEAAAMLQMLEGIGRDIECEANANDMSNCKVFSGQARTCKIAIGGVVDCCEKPEGVSIANYIKLYMATGRIDNMIMNLDRMPGLTGAYSSLRDPLVNAFDSITKPILSGLDQITGGIFDFAGETVGGGLIGTAKAKMMEYAGKFVADAFGEAVATKLFTFAPPPGGGAGLGPATGFAAPLMYVYYAYIIYQFVMAIIQLIWKCTEEEFELNVARELKKTHYLGTYCRKKVLGACVEKRQSYCEFNSPLSRIINQQARPQLGISWGTAKNPNCRGLTLHEINRIDWSRIDLGEWMDLLKLTGNLPEDRDINMQTLTSGQSPHLQHIDADRPDLRTRTEDRINDIDLNDINRRTDSDLRSQY